MFIDYARSPRGVQLGLFRGRGGMRENSLCRKDTSSPFQSCETNAGFITVLPALALSPSRPFCRDGVQRGLPLASPMRDTRRVYPHGVGWLSGVISKQQLARYKAWRFRRGILLDADSFGRRTYAHKGRMRN